LARLTYPRLLQLIERRPPGAVFFLHGEEEYLREEAVDRVVSAYLDEATSDFNHDQVRGSDVAAEQLASMIATPPMMAEYRVIVVRDAQGLSGKARDVVESVAASAPTGLILVLSATIPQGSKAKFYGNLEKAAVTVEFPAVDAMDLPGWLVSHARDVHGLELDIEAARALATAIGAQLGVLASELGKLAAYVGDSPRISLEDVRAVGGYIPRVDRWAWFDLVGEKRFGEALHQLPTLLETGENGVGLVIGITSQLLRVGLVTAGGREALERQLKPYQRWLAGRVEPQARRWNTAEIDLALEELLRTDRLLKSTSLTDRQALEELLLRLEAQLRSGRSAA
jgi:DNA polymerase III subunit delta